MFVRHNIIAFLLLLLLAASASAQSVTQVSQSVVAGGGTTSASGPFQVEGTAGQSVTGVSSGGSFKIESGFWAGAAAQALSNLSVDNLNAIYGGTVSLKATLSAAGANISGKLVRFSLNGTIVGTATTDAQGRATLNNVSLSGLNAGTYSTGISATIEGDAQLTDGNGAGQLTITKADPLVSVVGGSFSFDGQPHPATASATGVNNEVLGPISIFYNGTANIPVNAGSYAVSATFAGNENYNAATNNQQSITIGKANQTITFAPLSIKTFGDAEFTVNATASSGLAVSFAAAGDCTVTGNTIHITGAGSCEITALQVGGNNHNPAAFVVQSFNIAKASTTTTVTSSVTPSDVGQTVTFTATASSIAGTPTGTIDFVIDGTSAGAPVALSAGGVASLSTSSLAIGTHTVAVVYSGDGNFVTGNGSLSGGQQVKSQPALSINDVIVTEGNSGTVNAVFTVSLSAQSGQPVSVNYQTDDGTAAASSDYQSQVGTLSFAPGETTKTVTVVVNGDALAEADEGFSVLLSGAVNAVISDNQGQGTVVSDDFPVIQFSASTYTVQEDGSDAATPGGPHSVITVKRFGDLSQPASIDYMTSDPSALNDCNQVTGNSSSRCDYATTVGTLRFAAGESSKSIIIPIVNDLHIEGPEVFTITLLNAVGSETGTLAAATVTILDDDTAVATNPLDNNQFFIRELYIDFLGRLPEPGATDAWLGILNQCAVASDCDRIAVARGFVRSREFHERGYFAYRVYRAGVGRIPHYAEFIPDMGKVSGFLSNTDLEANKGDYVEEFMARAEFRALYDPTTGDPAAYVDKLLQTAGLQNHPSRTGWISLLTNNTLTRGQVLREFIESDEVKAKYSNEAFIVMNYFGFLRRDPDAAFTGWIDLFDQTHDDRMIINGFINSQEYRLRFGP